MTKKQLAARLRKMRRELDECAGWLEELAEDLDTPTVGRVQVVGLTEAAAIADLPYKTFAMRVRRDAVPAPLAVLANGPVWDRVDIERWAKRAA